MSGDTSRFANTGTSAVSRREPPELSWSERFRGALLGGAVGDALGSGVHTRSVWDIQHWFGRQGVADYLPVFGRRGGVTELTQLSVFTLEALLRARAVNGAAAEWLPTPVIRTNHLRWLYTQGVPWEFAMSGYLRTHPEPGGWLLERPQLFSTRNPGGGALAGLGKLAAQPPAEASYDPRFGPSVRPGFAECAVWAALTMVWSTSEDRVFAAGADTARLLTDDVNVHGATGFHADVLAQLIQGDIGLWDAVGLADARLSSLNTGAAAPAAVRRAVHAAMFATRGGRRPAPAELDAEFETEQQPGELGTALAAVGAGGGFPAAVLTAVNVSADSSVTGALAGQLAGALYGPDAIPPRWREELELAEIIETLCADAAEAFAPPPPPPPLPKWAQRYVADPRRATPAPRELGAAPPAEPMTTVDSGRGPEPARQVDGNNDPTMVIDLSKVDFDRPRSAEPAPAQPEPAQPEPQFPPADQEPRPVADTSAEPTDRTDLSRLDFGSEDDDPVDADRPAPSITPDFSNNMFGLSADRTDREELSRLARLVSLRPEEAGRIPAEPPPQPARDAGSGADAPADRSDAAAAEPSEVGGVADEQPASAFAESPESWDEPAEPVQQWQEPVGSESVPSMGEQSASAFAQSAESWEEPAEPVQQWQEPGRSESYSPVGEQPAPVPEESVGQAWDEPAEPVQQWQEPGRSESEPSTGEQSEPAPADSAAQLWEAPVQQPQTSDEAVAAEAPESPDEHADQPEPSETHTDPLPVSEARAAKPVSGGHAKPEFTDEVAPSLTERVLGCFLGGALGDALGSDLEFATAEQITERFGPGGPQGLREAYGVPGAITDDTQMTLFTAEGLIRGSVARRTLGGTDPMPEVQLAYQRWLHTQGVEWEAAAGVFHDRYPQPDGWLMGVRGLFSTRAPGKTIFRALSRFGDGQQAGSLAEPVNDSKGCGGVMRAAPVALYSPDPPVAFEFAARVTALTHGHPSGYLSAGALAVIVQQALLGQTLDDGVWLALQVLETWDGHEETSELLKLAVELAEQGEPTPEQIAETLGGGWVGEQALAIAVCAALAGGDVPNSLRIAVHHDGDSDSTGAICGNIVGALTGVGELPVSWLADLELRDVVEQIALDCVAEFGEPLLHDPDSPEPPADERPADEEWDQRYPVQPLPAAGRGDSPTALLPAVGAPVSESAQPGDAPAEHEQAAPDAPADPEPLAAFPAPKPAPRRIHGAQPAYDSEG